MSDKRQDLDELRELRERYHAKVKEVHGRHGGGPFVVGDEIWIIAKNRGGRWDVRATATEDPRDD